MPVSRRTEDDAKAAFQSCKSPDPKDRVDFYDSWVDYEEVSLKTLHQSEFQSWSYLFSYLQCMRPSPGVLSVMCCACPFCPLVCFHYVTFVHPATACKKYVF